MPHGGSTIPVTTMSVQRAPAAAPTALPGDHPTALPGDHPTALPGGQLACDLTFAIDQANCTVAVNITIPANPNPTQPASLLPGLHPADLQNRYALPSQSPGRTVALVDAYDDPNAEVDLAVYRAAFGLGPCTSLNGCFRKVNQHGTSSAYPRLDLGWSEEISLDADMVSAACPQCSILLVEANSSSFDDLGAAVDEAVALGATVVSNSYYGPEWSGERSYDVHYRHRRVAITVSAGDQNSPFYPAASPDVTAVGGTSLSGGSGAWTEQGWKYTGRGCSRFEPRPRWQQGTGCARRSTVDVAAVADPQTGVTMFDSTAGGWLVAGGTSVGAPLLAAAYALSGNPRRPAYSYRHSGAFYHLGAPGYDRLTGLGSPDGVSGL